MNQKKMAFWLKTVIIFVDALLAVFLIVVIPEVGKEIVIDYPEFSQAYIPWFILALLCGIVVYAALIIAWRVASNIGSDRAFSVENVRYLGQMAKLAVLVSLIYFAVNVIYLFLNINHPGILVASALLSLLGICASIALSALSHLTEKAAAIQKENDLTI